MTIDSVDDSNISNRSMMHQYESNLESDIRFEIESNHEASQVPNLTVKLFSKNSNLWSRYNVTDGRTDGRRQTTCRSNTALCVASRGINCGGVGGEGAHCEDKICQDNDEWPQRPERVHTLSDSQPLK